MWRWPVAEPVMMLVEFGAYLMLLVGKWSEVEVCATVTRGFVNLRVSQSLIKSSPPLVTTMRPSDDISMPLVHDCGLCASRISPAGREKGLLPLYMTSEPSKAAATRTLLFPWGEDPHATVVILVRPAEPAALDLVLFYCLLSSLLHEA